MFIGKGLRDDLGGVALGAQLDVAFIAGGVERGLHYHGEGVGGRLAENGARGGDLLLGDGAGLLGLLVLGPGTAGLVEISDCALRPLERGEQRVGVGVEVEVGVVHRD